MKIDYREKFDYIDIDIDKLRPNKSYDKLFNKRDYFIKNLLEKHSRIPAEFLIYRNCPTCYSNDYNHELSKDNLDLVLCKNCDTVYVNPIFNEQAYLELYNSTEYKEIMKELGENSHEYRVERFGNERISILKEFITSDSDSESKIKHLDIGCSTGFVVEAAQNNNWESIGIDLNSSAIEFGKKRNLKLFNCSLEELDKQYNNFDVITLFDVLEHVTEPAVLLKNVTRRLKKDGLVFVYVPNYNSASKILLGKNAHFIWPSHHLTYFSVLTLSKLFTAYMDYNVLKISTEGLDIIDIIWYNEHILKEDMSSIKKISNELQFFINAGCYGKNLRLIARKK